MTLEEKIYNWGQPDGSVDKELAVSASYREFNFWSPCKGRRTEQIPKVIFWPPQVHHSSFVCPCSHMLTLNR